MMKIYLLGGTELTAAVGEKILEMKLSLAGVCSVGKKFSISYNSQVPNLRFSDLEHWCEEKHIPHHRYENNASLAQVIKTAGADFGLVCGWYHYVPHMIRSLFPRGCAGIHASLLPELRGGAPLNWALIQGLPQTGVSLFELTEVMDGGRLYGQKKFPVHSNDTISHLLQYAQQATLDLMEECLPKVASGNIVLQDQKGQPTYGLQRTPNDSEIQWRQSALIISRLIRASSFPYAGAFSWIHGKKIILEKALFKNTPEVYGQPGQLFCIPESSHICVRCGEGFIEIMEARFESGEDALSFLKTCLQQSFQTVNLGKSAEVFS